MIRHASSSLLTQCCRQRRTAQSARLLGRVPFVNSIADNLTNQRNIHCAPLMENNITKQCYSNSKASISLSLATSTRSQLHSISRTEHSMNFSTTAASNPTADASSSKSDSSSSSSSSSSSKDDKKSENSKDKDGNKSKKDDSNLFLDNLGKIFLSSIGIVLFMLLRSTKSNNSRSALREDIENTALLDPLEIDDLRLANSDFTVEIWEKIVEEVNKRGFGQGSSSRDDNSMTYPEFLTVVVKVMKEAKGEGFTIQFGHLVDRVVIAELERMGTENDDDADGTGGGDERLLQKELPLPFLFAALSLALHSTVADRVRLLYESMPNEMDTSAAEWTVSGEQVCKMVQHLQNTCQLVPDAQIVETSSKVPYQTYRVGTGDELTQRAREGYGGKKGSAGVTKEGEGPVSLEDFHAILNSKAVCAWGECYVKKTGRTSTSDR